MMMLIILRRRKEEILGSLLCEVDCRGLMLWGLVVLLFGLEFLAEFLPVFLLG